MTRHPRMPGEPLVFVHVALVGEVPSRLAAVLPSAPPPPSVSPPSAPPPSASPPAAAASAAPPPFAPTTAAFYSISSPFSGLRGVPVGGPLFALAARRISFFEARISFLGGPLCRQRRRGNRLLLDLVSSVCRRAGSSSSGSLANRLHVASRISSFRRAADQAGGSLAGGGGAVPAHLRHSLAGAWLPDVADGPAFPRCVESPHISPCLEASQCSKAMEADAVVHAVVLHCLLLSNTVKRE